MTDLKAKAELTLSWVERAQKEGGGGIAAYYDEGSGWREPYLETTGYLIPTLVKWGRMDMAVRCADYLVSNQNPDGSFNGLGGTLGGFFDTGACLEGLQVAWELTLRSSYRDSADKARDWMRKNIDHAFIEIYQARSAAILGGSAAIEAWTKPKWDAPLRSHYLAYWLEGIHRMGGDIHEQLSGWKGPDRLIPFEYLPGWIAMGARRDLCATSQFAVLLNDVEMVEAVAEHVRADGGVPLDPDRPHQAFSWSAKYFLDSVFAVTHK
jgi:hypothetical protein